MKTTSLIYITENGHQLAKRLQDRLQDARTYKFSSDLMHKIWAESSALVFIMATGIVVRTIAPLLKDKKSDPAVVVLDEQGKFSISLVSGHLGGANKLAQEIAGFLGGEAVITTASDVNNLPPIDVWARDNGLIIENWDVLTLVGTRYVNNGGLRVYSDVALAFPEQFLRVVDPRFADVIITSRYDVYKDSPRCSIIGEGCATGACKVKGQVYLRPVNLVVGIGCNSNTSAAEIEDAVRQTSEEYNLVFSSIGSIATIELKGDEPGLRQFAEQYGLPVLLFTASELNRVAGPVKSGTVFNATGAFAVAEPASLLGSEMGKLIVSKQRRGNVTVAISEKRIPFGGGAQNAG